MPGHAEIPLLNFATPEAVVAQAPSRRNGWEYFRIQENKPDPIPGRTGEWGETQEDFQTAWEWQDPDPSTLPRTATVRDPHPTLADRVGAGLLDRALDRNKPMIRLEDAGLGTWFARTVRSLEPGNVVGFVAAGAGGGKTAFVHQWVDGMAKHSAAVLEGAAGGQGPRPQVTPVLFITEMQERDLMIRALARESGVQGALLRDPGSPEWLEHAARRREDPDAYVARELATAREARDRMLPAWGMLTVLDKAARIGTGADAVARIRAEVEAIRRKWEAAGADVLTVVVVIDPIHRLLTTGVEELAGLSEMLHHILVATHGEGWLTVFTSDTTKESVRQRADSKRDLEQAAEMAFRGSYQLLHVPDVALCLRTLDPAKEAHMAEIPDWLADETRPFRRADPNGEAATVYADILTPKVRWARPGEAPAFWYDRAHFRFEPIPRRGGGR